jgi:hypothetical protein
MYVDMGISVGVDGSYVGGPGNGVRGRQWHSLIDKVYALPTLRLAWQRVAANHGAAGIDRMSIECFEANAERYLVELAKELRKGSYLAGYVYARFADDFVALCRTRLRKREKRPGFGRTTRDHFRWPNAFFAEQGLFTLHKAHGTASQSR